MSLQIFRTSSDKFDDPEVWALSDNREVTLYKLHGFEKICWDRERLTVLRDLLNETLRET